MPDHSKWTFNYDGYGEVTSIGLPLGGSISYTWTEVAFQKCDPSDLTAVSRAVATRTVTDNNGHSYTWQYHWGTESNGTLTNAVTDALNNDTVHTFASLTAGSAPGCNLYETATQYYQGTGAGRTLIKEVDTSYSSASITDDTGTGSLGNVFATDITTTVYPSGKVSKVHRVPDGNQPTIFGNVVQQLEYDWGQGSPGPLVRETDTTYKWQVNGAYLTANMPDLPASVILKDGSGCSLSQTDSAYDDPAYLTNYAGILPTGTHGAAPNPSPVRGNLTAVTKWLAPASSCNPKGGTAIVSHTNWYDTGEVNKQIDALGNTTTHSYDQAYAGGYVTQTCSPSTNGVSHCVSGTYDFNTGLLTSFTDENATQQASGNTQGDSAHTTTYGYDLMFRVTSATLPPDPSNGGVQAQTTLQYPVPITLPFTVTKTRSVTPTLTDSITSTFDGLGRVYKTQHPLPNGTATVDTVYNGLGQVTSVSNPYFSTSDPTYGISQTIYDALGRATQVTRQDGSVSKVDYNVAPIQAAPGDCTKSTDESGRLRLACENSLGQLIEVHEPGDNFNGSQAGGSVTITGALKSQSGVGSTGATTASAQVTIGGSDAGVYTPPVTSGGCDGSGVCQPVTTTPGFWTYDQGTVHIAVNGREYDCVFGGGGSVQDTTASVAQGLVNAIQADASRVVNASVSSSSSSTVVLTAINSGSAGNVAFSSGSTSDFTTSPAGGNLSGGSNANPGVTVYDQGTITVSIGTNFTANVPYSQTQNGSAASLASALASKLGAANSPVTVPFINCGPIGSTHCTIAITSNTMGAAANVNVNVTAQSTQTQWSFSPPSFSGTSATLSGGYDPEGPSLDFNYFVTQYAYDGLGDLLTVTQKGDPTVTSSSQWRTRSFTHDTLGRLLTAQNPESGTISYAYDANSNLLQKTSPAANAAPGSTATQVITYCHDALNRVTGKAYSAQSCTGGLLPAGTAAVSYSYDAGANAIGKLTSLTDQAGSGSYAYDILGRMTGESRTIAGIPPKNMSYGYNLDGSLASLTYPSTATVTYTPDSAGRMLSAIDNGNPSAGASGQAINYATGATYGPDGSLTGFVSGKSGSFAGITNSFSFNKRLQPVNMSAASPSATVFSLSYDFHLGNGNNGNVWNITNNVDNPRSQAFNYDPLNRLISAQNAGTDCTQLTLHPPQTKYWGNSYGYDAWGNLLSKAVTKCWSESLSVPALANNQLSGYGYDAAGNMTSDLTDGVSAVYDPENRISTATKNGGTTSYTYDADGNRVAKSNGTTGTLYWYMTPGIVAESDLSGSLQSEYVFFDGERVARKDFPTLAVSYYFSDHLKTTDIVTDAQGTVKSDSDFYPWGGELQFIAKDSNDYKFTGKKRDIETGLDYFGARYYSNGLGRFDSADEPFADQSARDPQSWNLYSYVRNNPVNNVDRRGRGCESSRVDNNGVLRCEAHDHKAIGQDKALINLVAVPLALSPMGLVYAALHSGHLPWIQRPNNADERAGMKKVGFSLDMAGMFAGFTIEEQAIADILIAEGDTVVPLEVVQGQKNPDALVNGVENEFATLAADGRNTLKNRLEKELDQAANVTINANKTSLTKAQAIEQIKRVEGNKGIDLHGRVTVITREGILRY
jgi:RHS repeat-associated protein